MNLAFPYVSFTTDYSTTWGKVPFGDLITLTPLRKP